MLMSFPACGGCRGYGRKVCRDLGFTVLFVPGGQVLRELREAQSSMESIRGYKGGFLRRFPQSFNHLPVR